MKTKFQNRLIKDIETLWGIVKIYHPDIPETLDTKNRKDVSVKEERMSAGTKYDWVMIYFKVAEITVSIGITNCYQYKLFGPRISKGMMRKALSDGTCAFRTWRFSDDSKKTETVSGEQTEEDIKAVSLLKANGYQLQSVDEMYKIYYED